MELDDTRVNRGRNWCWTWNNYTRDDVATIKDQWTNPSGLNLRYVMFEEEVAPTTGTPHLQGLLVTHTVKSFNQLKALLPKGLHIERMRGCLEQNERYCSKDKTGVVCIGKRPETAKDKGRHGKDQGHRGVEGKAPSEANRNWQCLALDIQDGMPWTTLTIKYAYMFGMYNKGFTEMYELHKPKMTFNLTERHDTLYAWQVAFLDLLAAGADARSVHWIWSAEGNVGKTDTTKHLVSQMGFTPIGNGMYRDMSCAYRGTHTVIDIARSDDAVNYTFIEKAKDGMVFSSKYESRTKMSETGANHFVVCFANVPPDITKLSLDRWQVYRINADKTWTRGIVTIGAIWYE